MGWGEPFFLSFIGDCRVSGSYNDVDPGLDTHLVINQQFNFVLVLLVGIPAYGGPYFALIERQWLIMVNMTNNA